MKKKYESPEFELHKLNLKDAVLNGINWSEPENYASGGAEGDDEDPFADP